jgi:hypothetical protein
LKKILVITLIISVLFSFTSFCFADGDNKKVDEDKKNSVLVQSQIFFNEESEGKLKSKKIDVSPSVTVYPPGTVRIDDLLHDEGGFSPSVKRSFSSFESCKEVLFSIVPYIPVVGQYAEKGIQIYDGLKAIHSDMTYIDKTKQTEIEHRYNYRNFFHDLYVYTDNNTWKNVGYSLSKLYYKYTHMYYYTDIGEFRDKSYFYSHLNGYQPCEIARAAHYKNYTALNSLAYEAWVYNRNFYESY